MNGSEQQVTASLGTVVGAAIDAATPRLSIMGHTSEAWDVVLRLKWLRNSTKSLQYTQEEFVTDVQMVRGLHD